MEHEPLLARTISDANLAAWLEGGQEVAGGIGFEPPITPPDLSTFGLPDDQTPVRFPQVETAARSLAEKNLLTKAEFEALDNRAKLEAFTVAGVATEDALERIREALVEDISRGGTLQEFQARVEEALDVGALSPARIELIYRQNVGTAYADGQREILDHPLVSDEFPFVSYNSVRDSRRRDTHKYFETAGLNGTNIYWRNDPVIQRFWAPTWDWQCRCHMIPLTVEDAARRGVTDAKIWLRDGFPPAPTFVARPPFEPPIDNGRVLGLL